MRDWLVLDVTAEASPKKNQKQNKTNKKKQPNKQQQQKNKVGGRLMPTS